MAASLARVLAGEAARVGTENPAKLSAVRAALAAFAPSPEVLEIVAVNVASGVSEQPIGWSEIIAGARNRARAALSSGPGALAFGIEDGLVELPVGDRAAGEASDGPVVFNVGCAWVTDGSRDGTGFSAGFAYPAGCREPAFHDQVPVGALFDRLWQAQRGPSDAIAAGPSPRQGGNIGQLTQGRLDRSSYGTQAILCALVPFLHVDLYD